MAKVSQKTKYVKLDDGVSFTLVRTNPKLTTNTKLMYNGKKMYMESYASSSLLNRNQYKNVSVKRNGTYNMDIAKFLTGSGSQAYEVYQNFSDIAISDSYDNQFETMYWCGAEYIDSYFYDEEIGFIAPLYLREKLPNYFLIFRLDTPSNYSLNVDENVLNQEFDFKKDILDKAVLIKTFDLREGSVLGKYIRNYVDQELFEFDKSMYVNFSNAEVTYYGINKVSGVLEKKVESFGNELLKNDNPVLKNDQWFTEGFERNNLIFPYIMNIEYLFDDDTFKNNDGESDGESYDFARYIGVYCNNIEFGEFSDLSELSETEGNAIYYFEDNKKNLHRYTKINKNNGDSNDSNDSDNVDIATEYEVKIDGKDVELFDKDLISGFEKERVTGYAEPLDIYEGFTNRAQYGFEILKPFESGDWIGIDYKEKGENGNIVSHVECYYADNVNINGGEIQKMEIGEIDGFRFSVNENSTESDIAKALVKCVNANKKSKFEARCSDNVVVFYAKKEGEKYNGTKYSGAKILLEDSLVYNSKISLPLSNTLQHSNDIIDMNNMSDSDVDVIISIPDNEESLFGDYYVDYFCGACDLDIDSKTETYKNVFKIYTEEYEFFDVDRYLKTKNGGGRRIRFNMMYVDAYGKINPDYRIVVVDDIPADKIGDDGYDVSVSSTYTVEIMDIFKPNHGVLSWFPVKDFDFDINYSSYGQYSAFAEECNILSKKYSPKNNKNDGKNSPTESTDNTENLNSNTTTNDINSLNTSAFRIKSVAKSPLFDESGNILETEYDYYFEQLHPDLCLLSKSTPYISKWGYYDEQKDSCENPYRLNVSKVFGTSNLSANTNLRSCDETEYTHSMPYYMTFGSKNYKKNYQYILTDEVYEKYFVKDNGKKNVNSIEGNGEGYIFNSFSDCVDFWIDKFKDTDNDMFSYFFSGKKYGNRFDKKYSRLFGGNKMNNPSTLFRGVKFEVIRQYNGLEKKSSEYNDYKFSFVYIPIMIDSMVFNSTIYFVKNDTFKFIVGIVFVNTMLGKYKHNIFNGNLDYFGKGFLYAACKDIIRAENSEKNRYNLTIKTVNSNTSIKVDGVYHDALEDNYISNRENVFYMWKNKSNNVVFVSTKKNISTIDNIIFKFREESNNDIGKDIKNIEKINKEYYTSVSYTSPVGDSGGSDSDETESETIYIFWNGYYEEYDTVIYGYESCEYYGTISCNVVISDIYINNNIFKEICDAKIITQDSEKVCVDVSQLIFKTDSIKNILINMGTTESVISIKFYNDNDGEKINEIEYIHKDNCFIKVDTKIGSVGIYYTGSNDEDAQKKFTTIDMYSSDGETIENFKMNIVIKDRFDSTSESLGFKDYFSVFNQVSMYNITECINNDYNVEYYSTVDDNKYKIRVVEPDSIEIEDKYESIPLKITQNNKMIVGSVEMKEKMDVDKIGIKVINRYSGYYNPIFNDVLYYGDYSYEKSFIQIEDNVKFELPYSNTYIDYEYNDGYGAFGVIRNMYFHKTNATKSDSILMSKKPIYPAINEYALDYRDYNIFSSSWDDGYFISQDDLNNSSICEGIGSMKDGLCMFGSKYINLPDYIFIDTFENGNVFDDRYAVGVDEDSEVELLYKEINNRTVKYNLFIEKRLKRYLKEKLISVFKKYINKENIEMIEREVEEYVEKNLLKLYKVDKVYMYIKEERMNMRDKNIENEYLKYMDMNNVDRFENGFPYIEVKDGCMMKDSKCCIMKDSKCYMMKDSKFSMGKLNEFDRTVTYNLKTGFKESFGFGVSIRRK